MNMASSVAPQTDIYTDYELTEEQKLAMAEHLRLQKHFRGDLDEDEEEEEDLTDYGLGYPDYDVAQRLREINEQWDKEPLPDDKRQTLIEFKQGEQLTTVFEPPSVSDDSSNDQGGLSEYVSKQLNINDRDTSNILPGKPLPSERRDENLKENSKGSSVLFDDSPTQTSPSQERLRASSQLTDIELQETNKNTNNSAIAPEADRTETNGPAVSTKSDNSTKHLNENTSTQNYGTVGGTEDDKRKEERVLIEINGKFELVSVSELQAMGYPLPDDNIPSYQTSEKKPLRPTSAKTSSHETSNSHNSRSQRAMSAQPSRLQNRSRDWDASSYRSPYGLSPEQKELKLKRERLIRERELAYKERKKEEEKRRQEEAESAFQWWVSKKEEEKKQRETSANQSKSQTAQEKREEAETAFNAWCEAKREQQTREKLLKLRQQKERDECYFLRSREECDQAYRKWLKNKRKQEITILGPGRPKSKRRKQRSKSAKPSIHYRRCISCQQREGCRSNPTPAISKGKTYELLLSTRDYWIKTPSEAASLTECVDLAANIDLVTQK